MPKELEGAHVAKEEGGQQDEDEDEDEEACSEAYLRRISGEEDLAALHNLALLVDTNVTQVTLLKVHRCPSTCSPRPDAEASYTVQQEQ